MKVVEIATVREKIPLQSIRKSIAIKRISRNIININTLFFRIKACFRKIVQKLNFNCTARRKLVFVYFTVVKYKENIFYQIFETSSENKTE